MENLERHVAIDNKCAWPNLTLMPDGTIVTAYYCERIPLHQRYHMGVVRWRD